MFIDSSVSMEEVPVHHELDRHNDVVVLHCGPGSEYVLTIGRQDLANLIALGTQAIRDLPTPA